LANVVIEAQDYFTKFALMGIFEMLNIQLINHPMIKIKINVPPSPFPPVVSSALKLCNVTLLRNFIGPADLAKAAC